MMLLTIPKTNTNKGDIIAFTMDNRTVDYGEVITVTENTTLVSVGKGMEKILNNLQGEAIPYSIDI
ncbi:MAG: hypothetical protein N3I35_06625 [Clostridia bacterium]|nr:hypothetical protein [Clostridia bacterium]